MKCDSYVFTFGFFFLFSNLFLICLKSKPCWHSSHLHSRVYWSWLHGNAFLWQIFDTQLALYQNIDDASVGSLIGKNIVVGLMMRLWLAGTWDNLYVTMKWPDWASFSVLTSNTHFTASLYSSGHVYQPILWFWKCKCLFVVLWHSCFCVLDLSPSLWYNGESVLIEWQISVLH